MKCQFYFLSYVDDFLVVCRCIQIILYQIIFVTFVAKGDKGQFFWEIIMSSTIFINKASSFLEVVVLIFSFKSIFQGNANRFISLVKENNRKEFSCHIFSLNFIWINSPINFCYFLIFLLYETYSHLLEE